ncbi:flagellar assembly protein A [Caminibacter sp.]
MGLLEKFFNKNDEKNSEFQEKILITENVNKELLKISKFFNLPLSSLDFDILKTKTYISIDGEDFIEADSHSLELIKTESFLLNPNNKIKQVHEIKIKKYKPQDGFEIIGNMKINKLFTQAEFIISPKSLLESFNEIKLYNEMNKKKIRNSLLINVFDEEMKKDISSLHEVLLSKKLKKPFKIRLCKGIEPIPSIQGKVIFHYKKHKKNYKKELIYPIKTNEILIEIIKPKEGRGGRNCKGEYIEVEEVKEFNIPNIEYDSETVIKKEDEEKILFIAKKPGYVVKEDGKYIIKDKLEIQRINIKTGDVKNADESEVKMVVKESSFMEEAIGDGMVVEAKEVTVKGNVGNKAKVKAKKLEIKGKTHKNSILIANTATINTHRGKLKAKTAEIKTLENGIVKADKVKVIDAIGGEIIAKEVEIENLRSHVKIFGLKEILIRNLNGEENLLCISPKKVLDDTDIDSLQEKLKETEQNIEIVKRELRKRKELIEKNRQTYEDLKTLYLENKKANRKISPTVLMKLKEYKLMYEKFNSLKEKLENLKIKKETIIEEIDMIQNSVYNSKIISFTPWKAYNRIEFDLLEPPIKLTYDTKGDEGICGFKLRFFDDTPKIVKIKVDNDSGS